MDWFVPTFEIGVRDIHELLSWEGRPSSSDKAETVQPSRVAESDRLRGLMPCTKSYL
jgi:hypothetical protein